MKKKRKNLMFWCAGISSRIPYCNIWQKNDIFASLEILYLNSQYRFEVNSTVPTYGLDPKILTLNKTVGTVTYRTYGISYQLG
jgi:hypothetical protein